VPAFLGSDTWIEGAFALEQGFILTSMILAALTVALIGRRFMAAAVWCALAAALSAGGLIHSYRYTLGDTVATLAPAWPWAAGYTAMALTFLAARWLTVAWPDEEEEA
jgi:AGZA family xanthine/uracil permease-like MFS transporter